MLRCESTLYVTANVRSFLRRFNFTKEQTSSPLAIVRSDGTGAKGQSSHIRCGACYKGRTARRDCNLMRIYLRTEAGGFSLVAIIRIVKYAYVCKVAEKR